ncbi:hypothetical protein Sros_8692 [Streptosporangium roseum DSM 43021]|uniref:Uncharacterized protein n=1 Tax=Streptosporangium roseum (strain ATCC 12428 / DSM 43021 / JCM 3005 / KCTC 9067 / NCIMB 10171 / NRRL 2505 / NI 9100) TaxID=479432 RepID=D2B499_STRRD|nr:hypothetical protein Sros_8692 [Streptosporangium roseum DSM 43021]
MLVPKYGVSLNTPSSLLDAFFTRTGLLLTAGSL